MRLDGHRRGCKFVHMCVCVCVSGESTAILRCVRDV